MSETAMPVVIVDYDPAWPDIAMRLAGAIRNVCGDAVQRVEHIGSTSVPALAAKPIIDLMPVLARFEDGHACIEPMTVLGYDYRGEYGIAGRHYFTGVDGESGLRVHVHMLVDGSEEQQKHIVFRDYLRAHPAAAEAYASMKRGMAALYQHDREAYTEAKTPFILDVLARAADWRGQSRTGD